MRLLPQFVLLPVVIDLFQCFVLSSSTWEIFKTEFGIFLVPYKNKNYPDKSYSNYYEDRLRQASYKFSRRHADSHNLRYALGLETYKLAINKFSYMTASELESLRCVKGKTLDTATSHLDFYWRQNSSLPPYVNWCERGCVTPVRDQRICGSCWAFSVLGSLEGVLCAATGNLLQLSEQQLVDCCSYASKCSGCLGAWPEAALLYIRDTGGVMLDGDYPYTAEQGMCRFQKEKAIARECGYVKLAPGDEEGLAEAIALYGPISVSISTTFNFMTYESVGYGTSTEGIPYWLVKNRYSVFDFADSLAGVMIGVNVATLRCDVERIYVKSPLVQCFLDSIARKSCKHSELSKIYKSLKLINGFPLELQGDVHSL